MSIIQAVTVLIFATSVLTSSVNDTHNYLGKQPQYLETLFGASDKSDDKNPTILTSTRSVSSKDSDAPKAEIANQLTATDSSSLPTVKLPSSPKVPVFSEGINLSDVNDMPNSFKKNVSQLEETGKAPLPVPTEGAPKNRIMGRKGAPDSSDNDKPEPPEVTTKASTTIPVPKTQPSSTKFETNTKLDNKVNATANKSSNPRVLTVPGTGNDNTPKHIYKPTYLTGDGDDNGRMPSSPTQTQSGIPGKVDYIIPVVITIMATPILAIAAYVLYTRGRDCWDKRHYRRMDFLIDGMYND